LTWSGLNRAKSPIVSDHKTEIWTSPKILAPLICRRKNFAACFLDSLGHSESRKIKIRPKLQLMSEPKVRTIFCCFGIFSKNSEYLSQFFADWHEM
jgi:hypothetical protein